MESEEYVKTVYVRESVGPNRRGKSTGRWKDRVKEYMYERYYYRGRLDQARRECLDRERWRLLCRVHSLERNFQRECSIRAIDR